jgi:DNA-binding response OmpR family regulator
LATTTIFLLEDDLDFSAAVQGSLQRNGFVVCAYSTPHELFYEIKKMRPSLLIVDWMLPEMNGLEVVKHLRQLYSEQFAIMMLTQMDTEEHIVNALKAGADDFLVKPECGAILIARVNAVLRRYRKAVSDAVLIVDRPPYRLLFQTRQVYLGDQLVALAPREFDLLWALFQNPNRLYSRAELLAAVWGKRDDVGEHTLTQHIYAIRKKLSFAEYGYRVTPVYGSGYRFECPSDAAAQCPVPDRN